MDLPHQWDLAAGVLLEDPATDRLYLRLRRDWNLIAPEEAEVLSRLEQDWAAQAAELGASAFLSQKEDTLSNNFRVSDRRETVVGDFTRALGRLYRQHVSSKVQEFVTHLPLYGLAAAAGPFLENPEVQAEGWIEAPEHLRLTPEMFVATVTGRSMLPLIPDGALCVFRRGVTGSRNGRLVLVEARGAAGMDDRYTVKRYRSVKSATEEGWRQQRISLEPLNPEFEAWDLDPGDLNTGDLNPGEERYQILAEFVEVLD